MAQASTAILDSADPNPRLIRALRSYCISYGLQRHSFFVLSSVSIFYFTILAGGEDASARGQLYHSYFFAGLYLAPVIVGAFVSTLDAQRRSVYLGELLLVAAFASLAFKASRLLSGALLFAGVGFLNANFRTVFSSSMRQHRGDGAACLTWLYFAGNIGSLASALIISEKTQREGPGSGVFLWCVVCLILSLVFWWNAEGEGVGSADATDRTESPKLQDDTGTAAQPKIFGVLFATLFSILFWLGFDLKRGRITQDANRSMSSNWMGMTLTGVRIQSVNPLVVMLLGGLFARNWKTLADRGRDPHPATKMGAGLCCLGMGFVILATGLSFSGGERISPVWFMALYACHSIGELLFEPIGQDFVIANSTTATKAFFLAVWDAAEAGAYFGGGTLALLLRNENLYWFLGAATVGAGAALVAFRARLSRG